MIATKKVSKVQVKRPKSDAKSPLVTVVIPTYNRAKYIRRGIKSVLRQTTKQWRLLIVDDGSTDKTRRVIRRYLKNPRIRYVARKKNQGVSSTLAYALKLVNTKYFSQLDADDWYAANTLKTCLKKMAKSSSKVALVYGDEKVWKAKSGGRIKFLKRKKKRRIRGKYDFITYHPMVYPRFYRTAALRKVGGWSTSVPQKGRFAEDRQILLKLAGRYRFRYVNKTLYNRLSHNKNNSRIGNRYKYASVTKYLYKRALKQWGNRYKPKFVWKGGRLKVGKVIKKRK